MLISLSENYLKISNFEKKPKRAKTLKDRRKKTQIFFLFSSCYVDWHNFYNKNYLFDAKLFEFEKYG